MFFFYFGLFSTCKKEGNSKMWHIYFQYLDIIINYCKIVHSMARANLNKSEKFLTNTIAESKYIPRRSIICINWNTPFQAKIYVVKVHLNVNIVRQDSLYGQPFLKFLWSEVWKRWFQLMQILGPLGMCFDAAVVFFKNFYSY